MRNIHVCVVFVTYPPFVVRVCITWYTPVSYPTNSVRRSYLWYKILWAQTALRRTKPE